MKRRVVITGLGIVSPVGNDITTAWDNIVNGRSGISRISRFDPSAITTHIAGEVKDFDISTYISSKEARQMDTFIHYGLAAGMQAWRDCGLEVTEANAERIGVIVGSGIGGLPRIEETQVEYLAKGPRRISPFFVPGSLINLISGHISITYGMKGPSYAVVSACTTGLHSIGDAARLIEYGDADVMLAGGAESTVSPLGIGGFAAMRACRRATTIPRRFASLGPRPRRLRAGRGRRRAGAGRVRTRQKRGARIYGEFAGYGMSSDAHHITAPDKDGPRRGILNALRNGGLNLDDIQYVNAHGTSTPLGDKNESEALKLAFGDHAKKLVVNSTKSMTGHLLGAAGRIEAVFTTLAVYNQVSPPTINIFNQDPECDLDYCANEARQMKIDVGLSNSFGFGGTNGSMAVRRV